METLLSPDFWSDQIASAAKAWAILILLVLGFWATLSIKRVKTREEMDRLKAYEQLVESRLQLARDLNSGETKAIVEIRSELDRLRQSMAANAEPRVLEQIIREVDASAATLVMASSATNHVLTAEKLAIGDVDEGELKTKRI